jgi:FixJ family two-component response regulator
VDKSVSPLVIVVDDDLQIRESFADLFASVGLEMLAYPTVAAFLQAGFPDRPTCLLLDVRLPGESGLDLQENLRSLGVNIPIIFITGFADVAMSVRAMKRGAVNFLAKPLREQDLLDAVSEALREDQDRRERMRDVQELRGLAAGLTPREAEVLKGVGRGLLSKQIAYELGIAETTVKMHRSSVFKKLKAVTPGDLVQKARILEG